MKRRTVGTKEQLMEQVERSLAARGEKIAERWSIEEFEPAYEDEYDRDIPERVVDRSPFFDTKEEAIDFMDTVIPDYGTKFRLKYEECFEKTETTRTWYYGRLPRESDPK